jgi:preprotein translocase subunit SecA
MRIFGSERVSKFMDKFGYKEGDMIEHSWMTKTIERNQKRMEQNNFGIRKRLLEYDDVMNKQRTNIYRMRRNALYGDRLSIDLKNMLFNWCSEQVQQAKDADSYEQLEMEVIKTLASALPFDQSTFHSSREEALIDQLFVALTKHYTEKNERMRLQALPVFKNIYSEQGDKIENVVVPMTDGFHNFQIVASMKKAMETDCKELIHELEKMLTLQMIDDEWKDHLRELDELKQSTYNAQYEQKDPLLIYKIESFELFGQMLNRLNQRVLGMLFRSQIESSDHVEEAKATRRREDPKVKTGREEIAAPAAPAGMEQPAGFDEPERIPQSPIRNELKVGRNDPCPCGSGKKFKSCHGKD